MDRKRILIVDDLEANVRVLSRLVSALGHDTDQAANGLEALTTMQQRPPDLVLLDIEMPVLTGFEVLERVREDDRLSRIPIIIVSALADSDSVVQAIKLGAYDYVLKPYNRTILEARINSVLKRKEFADVEEYYSRMITTQNVSLQGRVLDQIMEISAAQNSIIFAMSKLTESRDSETGKHLQRIREYCRLLAESMLSSEDFKGRLDGAFAETMYTASPLHDIGKVGVPDHILLKPGKLTPEEFELIKPHTTLGADTLRAVLLEYPQNKFVGVGIEICENHHENWDGTGYPHGIAGDAIPLSARVVAVSDVYDALRSKRPYKEPWTHEQAVEEMFKLAGTKFDPAVVGVFKGCHRGFEGISVALGD